MSNWMAEAEEAFRRDEQRVAHYEETLVKRILNHAGVPFTVPGLKARAADETNEHTVSFDFFAQEYPRFPVLLGAAKIKWTHEIQVGHLFGKHFMQLSCMKEYQNLCASVDADPRENRVGLVFNWAGIDAGGSAMVLHNYPPGCCVDAHERPRGTFVCRPYGSPVVVYVIEAFNDFLDSVGTGWAVDEH